ncbi:MAG: COG1470 family protein, partial [Planctomycetota bacterium]
TTVLFEPCVEIVKEPSCGFSKVGDTVLYDYTITNCSEEIDLELVSVIDDKVGDITQDAIDAGCATLLAPGGTCTIEDVPYVVQPGDDTGLEGATLVNHVIAIYDGVVEGVGIVGQVDANDIAEVTLLHPDLALDVDCELAAEPGDVDFDVTVTNTGDVALIVNLGDPFNEQIPLDAGASALREITLEVDGDCLCGSATLEVEAQATIDPQFCNLPNLIPPEPLVASATCETEPCIFDFTVTKECDASDVPLVLDGVADFDIVITNTGNQELLFLLDDPAASISGQPVGPLAPGVSETVEVSIDAPLCAPPVLNEAIVTALCIDGTQVGLEAAIATCEVPCFDYRAEKECLDTTPGDVADGAADFLITVYNDGDVPLSFDIEDIAAGYSGTLGPVAPGGSDSVTVSVPVTAQSGCPAVGLVDNSATVTVIGPDGSPLDQTQVIADCPPFCIDFDLSKVCNEPERIFEDGEIATYTIEVTNTGDADLLLEITDLDAVPPIDGQIAGPVAPGATYTMTIEIPIVCTDQDPTDVPLPLPNTVTVIGIAPDGTEVGPKTADADCTYICRPVGGEGCTPGFWKNHTDCWCDAYTPDMLVSEVWTALQDPNYVSITDSKSNFATDTLMDSIRYRGGGGLAGTTRNMLRHATAALLNACSDNVAYPVSVGDIIDGGNTALATEDIAEIHDLHMILAGFNEDSPCPINAHCEVTDDDDYVDPR